MNRKLLAVLLAAAVAAPAVASAQISTGFSIAAGASLPTGDFGDAANTGYNAAVGLNLGVPLLPVGVRVEGAYNHFDFKGSTATGNIVSGTVNATVGLGMPYVIGGIGYYSASATGSTSRANGFGINGGVGVRLPLGVMTTFVEARYHKAMGDVDASYIPITFGIQF